MTSPRRLLTVLVCFCFFYIALSSDLINDPHRKNNIKLRRDGKFDHHAIVHETYVSGFPVRDGDEPVAESDDSVVSGKVPHPFRTTSLGEETPPVIFSTTSTITTEVQDESARKNQVKINKLMLDMLAAGVGDAPRVHEEDEEGDW